MSIPKGYKLVPVELIERAIAATMTARGRGSPTERDLRAAIAAPTPPQPTYDEAKERELFEAQYMLTPKRWADGYADPGVNNRWKGWQACAQSRAKAGEDV